MKVYTKNLVAFFAITVLFVQTVNAQGNTQKRAWGEWYQLSGDCQPQPCGAAVSFFSGDCKNSNGLTWKFRNDQIVQGAYIKFKFDHRKCDGTVKTDEVTLYLDRTGEWKSSGDLETANSYEVVKPPYDIRSSNKDKAKQVKNDVNDAIKNYNQQYNDAITAANKVKDPTKHNQLIQQINTNKDAFHQLDLQAQNQMNQGDGNALAQTLTQMKQQQSGLKTIYLRIDPDEPVTPKNNTSTTTNNPPTKSTTSTTSINTQQNQYQTQSNNYLNKANTDQQGSIQQAYDYNMAKINALGAGNKTQVQAIEEQQKAAQQQAMRQLQNQAADNISTALTMNDERKDADRKQAAQKSVDQYTQKINSSNDFIAKTNIIEDDIKPNKENKTFIYTTENEKGFFEKTGDKTWGEFNSLTGKQIFTFSSIEEKPGYALLYDSSRKVYLKIESNTCLWGYSKDNITNKIHDGYWIDKQPNEQKQNSINNKN